MFANILQLLAPGPRDRSPLRLGVEALEDRVVPAPVAGLPFGAPGPLPLPLLPTAARPELDDRAARPVDLPLGPFVGFGAPLPSPELLARLRQTADRARSVGLPLLPFPAPEDAVGGPFVLPQLPQTLPETEGYIGTAAPTAPPSEPAAAPVALASVNLSGSDVPVADGSEGVARPGAAESRPEPNPVASPDPPATGPPTVAVEPDADVWDFAPIRELARDAWAQVEAELPDLNLPEDFGDAAPALWQVGVCLVTAATVWAVVPRRKRTPGDAPAPAERPERNPNP